MDMLKHPIGLWEACDMSVFDAALFYLEQNISVLPVIGKKPAMWSWSHTQTKRVPFSWVHQWQYQGYLKGVGVVLGAVSENLVVIDLDGTESVDKFRTVFPELFDTYEVLSGSGKGRHLYFYVEELPPTTRTKGFELRANGCYVVAPPSPHVDTQAKYMPMNQKPVTLVKHLRDVVTWIQDRIVKPPIPTPIPVPTLPTHFTTETYEANARKWYFNRSLEGEIRRVTSSSAGTRNDNLNMAAFCIGGLCLTALDYAQAETALLDASRVVDIPELEARRTIKSGLTAGMSKPRPYPKAR